MLLLLGQEAHGLDTLLVDIATLISTVMLIVRKDLTNNVMLVESFGPALWNLILYLVLNKLLVRRLSESSLHGLFMKLIELVVETGNHVLNLRAFFFGLKAFNDGLLDFLGTDLGEVC